MHKTQIQLYLQANRTLLGNDSRPIGLGAEIHGHHIWNVKTLQDHVNLGVQL